MLLFRSPSIIFSLVCSVFSIILTILSFDYVYTHTEQQSQLLIILPPLNIIFLFLSSLIWTERRFRLAYIPFVCFILLLLSTSSLTIVSYLLLPLSIIFYFNFTFYLILSILTCSIILILIMSFFCSLLTMNHCQNVTSIQELSNESSTMNDRCEFDKLILKSNENEFILFISKLSKNSMIVDISIIKDSLNQIEVDTILILNDTNKFSYVNMTNNNYSNIDLYSMQMKQSNIEQIIYPINARCIPKSISDYMQFLYEIILSFNYSNRNRLFIHCWRDMGRIGMTMVCFELLFEYINNQNQQETRQKFIERICHYPLLLNNYCRVCQAISNVRKIRPRAIDNPLQILYVHEFYARLKAVSYMEQIKKIVNQKFTTNSFEELQGTINI